MRTFTLALTLSMALALRAHASPPIPPCAWTPGARDALLRIVQLESERREDAAPIAFVLARRWAMSRVRHRRTFEAQVVAYSRGLRRHARALLDGTPLEPLFGARQLRILRATWTTTREHDLRSHLEAWAAGDVPDPCDPAAPPAYQWAARSLRSPLEIVNCGNTGERFYALPHSQRAYGPRAPLVTSCESSRLLE